MDGLDNEINNRFKRNLRKTTIQTKFHSKLFKEKNVQTFLKQKQTNLVKIFKYVDYRTQRRRNL